MRIMNTPPLNTVTMHHMSSDVRSSATGGHPPPPTSQWANLNSSKFILFLTLKPCIYFVANTTTTTVYLLWWVMDIACDPSQNVLNDPFAGPMCSRPHQLGPASVSNRWISSVTTSAMASGQFSGVSGLIIVCSADIYWHSETGGVVMVTMSGV